MCASVLFTDEYGLIKCRNAQLRRWSVNADGLISTTVQVYDTDLVSDTVDF